MVRKPNGVKSDEGERRAVYRDSETGHISTRNYAMKHPRTTDKETKRTIKPAAAHSRVTAEDAKSAARTVYRSSVTGQFVIVERDRQSRDIITGDKSRVVRVYPRTAPRNPEKSSADSATHRSAMKKR